MKNDESTNVMNSEETEENSNSSAESFQVNEDSILCKDFDIIDNIGKGAFAAAVYKVRNRLDGKLYAIKVIPCEKLNDEIPKEIEFLTELDHPNVVRYCSSWTDGAKKKVQEDYGKDSESSDDWVKFERGSNETSNDKVNTEDISPTSTNSNDLCICMYIQMEFCETTLRNVIDGISNMPLSLDENEVRLYLNENPNRILRLITHIVKGLAYIHSNGIIHRDLKPENILIDRNDIAKIGDFGLATWNNALANGKASHTGEVGTPMYDAPELDILCSGSKAHYNQKVDMYSLGIIVYEMCCPRFETAMERKEVLRDLRRSPVLIRQFEPPKGQLKLILELLDHDAKRRPSADEILKNGYLIFDEISMNPNTTSELVRRTNLLDVMKIKARKIFELHGGTYTSAESSPHTVSASDYFEYLIENSSIHPKVYSFNEVHNRTSDVITLYSYNYARFDMVFLDSVPTNVTMTVEALEIAYEFVNSFSGWVNISDFVIRLTHSKIISAVTTFQTAYQSGYFDENLMDLPLTDDVSIKRWKEIIQMNDESENVHILSLIRHSKTESAYNDLTRLVNLLKSRKMKCPIVIASKLDESNQYSEIVFQIVCENKVIASGDRYRSPATARQMSNSENHSIKLFKQQSVIGVTIFFTHFTDILEPKNIFLSKFEVLICTVSCNMLLKEKLDLAKKLREVGIRCTISHYNYRNLRAIERYVEKTMVHYAVLLEKNKFEIDHQVTLYSRICGNNFQEEDIAVENIVPYLKKTIDQSSLAQFLSF